MLVWSFLSACNASITILLSNVAKSPYYKIIQLGITYKNTHYSLIQLYRQVVKHDFCSNLGKVTHHYTLIQL
jgi:hypothetical protein